MLRLAAFLLTALAAAGTTRPPPESAAPCPYDLSTAARMIPPECFANATAGQAATGCCWYVLAAYIFAAADHANRTGEAFLPRAPAAACSGAFAAALVSGGLVSRSLLAAGTDGSCDLTGDRLAAGSRPCQLAGVEAVRAQAPRALPNATRLCAGSPAPAGCPACRAAVIAATYEMLATARTKEFVPCGMAVTVAVWSRAPPPLDRFRAYALCMLQVLENVNSLGTSNLVPSPPPPPIIDTEPPPAPSKPAASSSSSRRKRNTSTIPIAAGSAVASVAAVFSIVFAAVVISTRMRRRRRQLNDGTDSDDDDSSVATTTVPPPLPREGLYIFTKAELVQATNGYEKRLLLGTGGAGKVYLGTLPSGQRVAVKRMYRSKKVSEFYAEASVLATLRHRNLATLVGYCLGDRHHALVYEYMAGGSLCRALSRGDLSWRRRLRVAADIAEGLAYLHALRVVHRDVKPANVLLSSDLAVAKLSDFGVARAMPAAGDGRTHLSTEVRGTRGYVDPETFAAGHVTEAADVYGFGVVLLELATGMRAVVPTPSGGAESVVHAAHRAVAEAAAGGEEGAAADAVVDRRLGPLWDRPTVRAVFALACRCVRPYKHERPEINEVFAVLRAALADYGARANGDAGEGSEGTGSSSAATLDPASLPSTSSSTVNTR